MLYYLFGVEKDRKVVSGTGAGACLEDNVIRIKRVSGGNDSREANLLRTLNHPGIPRLYLVHSGILYEYMVLEYFPGSTLGEYVRRGRRFEVAEIVAIGVQLCGILDHVHSVHGPNIILTDIQPDNLVWHEDTLRLIDLGDYMCSGNNQTGKLRGTSGFVAPEVYGGGDICEATEIFAVGRVLQYLLDGRNPHGRSDCARWHSIWHRGDERVRGAQLSSLMRLISSCTCTDISRRPKRARELMEKLLMVLHAHSPGK